MKTRCNIVVLLLFLISMVACSPGHLGSNEIAFVRDGHLWTIDPNGANAFEIVSDKTPVVGYGWSPTHQLLVYRTLDTDFAKTAAAKHIMSNPLTQLPGDLPSTLNTISIDGGTPIPLIFSSSDVRNSNAWWNTTGSRLIYRATLSTADTSPNSALWWISQNDQPGGIARKLLPDTFSIPSIIVDSSMAIGNSRQGLFTTALDGSNVRYLVRGVLPGHPLFASLERVLWQPAHEHPTILYAIAPSSKQTESFNTSIQLVLRDMQGHVRTVATCACTQFGWAPDGNAILYSTDSSYTILDLKNGSAFSFSSEEGSVPYWSPDSQFLLLDGLHTLTLLQVASRQQQVLSSDDSVSTGSISEPTVVPDVNILLQPVSNSLWSADSRHFLFLTKGRLSWQGKSLSSGKGLYTVTIDGHGKIQGSPTLVDNGNDTQAGWSYEDMNTSFLF